MLHNGKAAAIRAGYPSHTAEKEACRLLLEKQIQKELSRLQNLSGTPSPYKEALAGIRQIAFGSAADIVRLVLEGGECCGNLEEMDLSLLAEIKKPKEGALEAKLLDRTKALELLLRLPDGSASKNSAADFYKALEEGACALKHSPQGDDDE